MIAYWLMPNTANEDKVRQRFQLSFPSFIDHLEFPLLSGYQAASHWRRAMTMC